MPDLSVFDMETDPEWTDGRFRMIDKYSAEVETFGLIAAFIRRTKPKVVVECGTFKGVGACFLARALRENGSGRLFTIEKNELYASTASERIEREGFSDIVTLIKGDTTKVDLPFKHCDIIFHDADRNFAPLLEEMGRFYPIVRHTGFMFIHDSAIYGDMPKFRVQENCFTFAERRQMGMLNIPTARGIIIMQKN